MTELLSKAIRAVEVLDPAEQNRIAEVILILARAGDWEEIDPEHLDEVMQGLAEVERGDFSSAEELEAAFASFHQPLPK